MEDKRQIVVGDIVEYAYGGELEVIHVDIDPNDVWKYQCCLRGGDKFNNAWFRRKDLTLKANP